MWQVVKVLHGADWDILWLQRDFGIYVANLFDTGQACRVLKHPRLGLGHMLTRLCAVQVPAPLPMSPSPYSSGTPTIWVITFFFVETVWSLGKVGLRRVSLQDSQRLVVA